jgi:hypothetical protein
MTLAKTDTIDFLSVEEGGRAIVLVIADESAGREFRERVALLQAKAYRYLDCISSGEALTRAKAMHPGVSASTPVRIEIRAMEALDGEGPSFIEHLARVAKGEGVELAFGVGSGKPPLAR